MQDALSHLKVVELCQEIPGAFCARQFAAWSADVQTFRRVEPDSPRAPRPVEPSAAGRAGERVSLLWQYVDAAKRVYKLDQGHAEVLIRLGTAIQQADVFVTDWSEADLRTAGLAPASLSAAAPALVITWLRPFGSDGPYAGWQATDLIIQALSGFLTLNGDRDREPVKAPANVIPYACGVSAFVGTLAALYERLRSGSGQLLEVSYLEAVASLTRYLRTQYFGFREQRHGGVGPEMFLCQDGYAAVNAAAPMLWEHVLTALGIPPDSLTGEDCRGHQSPDEQAVRRFMTETLRGFTAQRVFEACNEAQISAGLVLTPTQLLTDKHLAERDYFHSGCEDVLEGAVIPGAPALVSALGEAGTAGRGATNQATGPERRAGASEPPLHGVRVVDMTQAWMGPYASMLLAGLGADVVKVESPHRPDIWRITTSLNPQPGEAQWALPRNPSAHQWNTNDRFNSTNCNKRGLSLDLRDERGRDALRRLLKTADVLMVNYTPRVMRNFGFPNEELHRINPHLHVVSFSGYGSFGPYSNFKANAASIEAISGWEALFGYNDRPPMSTGAWQADSICGLQMAAYALTALIQRERSGNALAVDGSMMESAASFIGEEILLAGLDPSAEPTRANEHREYAPHGLYPCAGDDRWIAIAIRGDEDWRRLCAWAPSGLQLDRPAFATRVGRVANSGAIDAALSSWSRTQDAHLLAGKLQQDGVPAAPVLHLDEVLQNEHLTARGWFQPVTHPDMGTHLYNSFPWRYARTPVSRVLPPPRIGEHSHEILTCELGFTEREYLDMQRDRVSGPVLEASAATA